MPATAVLRHVRTGGSGGLAASPAAGARRPGAKPPGTGGIQRGGAPAVTSARMASASTRASVSQPEALKWVSQTGL